MMSLTRLKNSLLITLPVACLVIPGMALAQIRPPSASQPSQVQQRIAIPQNTLPDVGGEPVITLPQEEGKHKTLKGEATFVLKGVKFQDLTVFTPEELRKDYQAYLGKDIGLSTLHDIAFKVTTQYRNAGYILSRAVVPPQEIGKDGIAKIRIVEGYVNKVVIQGNHSGTDLIDRYAQHIRDAKPLDAKTLERYLLLMNDLPGVSAHAVLRPATDAPGASDVVITIDAKHFEATATVDNRGTRYMGPVQFGATAGVDNAVGIYDRTLVHGALTAEENELRYIQFSNEEQLNSYGTKFVFSYGYTQTHPTYTLATLDMDGLDQIYTALLSHPIIRSRQSNLYANLQFDWHDTDLDISDQPLYNDHLRVLRGGLAYDFVDPFSGVNKIQGQISHGFNWGIGNNDTTLLSRTSGQTSFTKESFTASRLQTIKGPFDFYVAGTGQLSPDQLLIGEQMSLGGADFGSAYDPAELTGDNGAAGRLELRYNRDGDFAILPSYQLYTFYDIGKIWNNGTPFGSDASLADTGLGLRFNAEAGFSGGFEVAFPLTKAVSANAVNGNDGYDPRAFFSLAYRY